MVEGDRLGNLRWSGGVWKSMLVGSSHLAIGARAIRVCLGLDLLGFKKSIQGSEGLYYVGANGLRG